MSALSNYTELKWLDHLLRNTVFTQPATLYVGLFTADPGESGVVGELTIGALGYTRAVVTNNNLAFPQCAVTGTPTKANGSTIQFPTASAAWGTITHWAIYDAASAGNMIVHGAFSSPRYVAAGDAPKIAAGVLSFTITNAASGGLTDFAKRKLLDHTFGGPTYTPAATVYLGAGTALSGESLTEWTESSYARLAAAFDAAAGDGLIINADEEVFTTNVVDGTATLTAFGVWDDPISGNLLLTGPLSSARTVNNGDTAKFADSSFTCTAQ